MEVVSDVYKITATLPKDEQFGLSSQIRRSAVSIPSNIAEGAARQTSKSYASFLHIAQASLAELDTQLEISVNLGFIDNAAWTAIDTKLIEVDKMLSGLIRSVRAKETPPLLTPLSSLLTPYSSLLTPKLVWLLTPPS